MRTLYYVFDTGDLPSIIDEDYCIVYVNTAGTNIEHIIDMSLVEYLNEPVQIVFSSRTEKLADLAKEYAKKYSVCFTKYEEIDIIQGM